MEEKIVSKRVDLVSVKLIKAGSILYEPRRISSPKDAFELDIDCDKTTLLCPECDYQLDVIEELSRIEYDIDEENDD